MDTGSIFRRPLPLRGTRLPCACPIDLGGNHHSVSPGAFMSGESIGGRGDGSTGLEIPGYCRRH